MKSFLPVLLLAIALHPSLGSVMRNTQAKPPKVGIGAEAPLDQVPIKEESPEVGAEAFIKEDTPAITEEAPIKEETPEVGAEAFIKEDTPAIAEEAPIKEETPEVGAEAPIKEDTPAIAEEAPIKEETPELDKYDSTKEEMEMDNPCANSDQSFVLNKHGKETTCEAIGSLRRKDIEKLCDKFSVVSQNCRGICRLPADKCSCADNPFAFPMSRSVSFTCTALSEMGPNKRAKKCGRNKTAGNCPSICDETCARV